MSEALVKETKAEIQPLEEDIPVKVSEAFTIPSRNWNSIIENYNAKNRKFFLTALDCKSIIEHVKRGIPPQFIFKSLGYLAPRYRTICTNALDLEERYEALFIKEHKDEDELAEFHALMYHPLRVLMADITRAEGVSDLMDWELFNEKANSNYEMMAMKMKAKFKEIFGEKASDQVSPNVVINLGGAADWLDKL